MPRRPKDTFAYITWPVNDWIVLCQMVLPKKSKWPLTDLYKSLQFDNGFLPGRMDLGISRPQRTPYQLFGFLQQSERKQEIRNVIILRTARNDGIGARASRHSLKTKWLCTYSLVVGKLKPGLILHGALAQVDGCRGKRETGWDIKRAKGVSLAGCLAFV